MNNHQPPPYLLIAEDDPNTARMVADLAQSLGWEVVIAPDGMAATQIFDKREPDLVLLDYFMPFRNGFEVLRHIRKSESSVPVVMMTAAGDANTVLEALRLGATDFLRKPFEHIALLKGILLRENQRFSSRHTHNALLTSIISQSIEFELENDLTLVIAASRYIVDHLVRGSDAYPLRLGLEELAINAIEHGNLGFTRDEKTEALQGHPGQWRELIRQRAADPVYASRRARIIASVEGNQLEVTVQDQGNGFDFRNIPDPLSEENVARPNGRGVFLARLQFDELEYLGRGNIVRVRKLLGPPPSTPSTQARQSAKN